MFRIQDTTTLIKAELTNANNASLTFLENGATFAITHRDILINQILGHPIDGGWEICTYAAIARRT